jgi:hypothetical protein
MSDDDHQLRLGGTWLKSDELSPVDAQLEAELLRLLPLHDVSQPPAERPPAPLAAATDAGAAPKLLLRIGKADHEAVADAIGHAGLTPAGVLVALTERPVVLRKAGAASAANGIAFGGDPGFFRCVLDDYRKGDAFKKLKFAPSDEHGPWRLDELEGGEAAKVARAVLEEQADRHRGLLVGATVAFEAPEDPALDVAEALLKGTLRARSAWGRITLLAPLIVRMKGFMDLESQLKLVRRLRRYRPDAFLLHLDGVEAASSGRRLAAALRLALLLQAGGVPVILARAGPLRRLFAAYGVAGYEVGLGRFERFLLSDFTGTGGGGTDPAKVEIPSLACALSRELALLGLAHDVLPEEWCPCASCDGRRLGACLDRTIAHDAAIVAAEAAALGGVPVAARIDALGDTVANATHLVEQLLEAGVDVRAQTTHLARWAKAMEIAAEWELGDADQLRSLRRAA